MPWYALHVMTGREDIVCEKIRTYLDCVKYADSYKFFVVKREILERRQGIYSTVLRVMFPGYVLVESEDVLNLAWITKVCRGVFRYLTREGEFQEVAAQEMAQIICLTNEEGLIGISDVYREGDSILPLGGPLKDCWGRVLKFDTYNRRAKVEFVFDGKTYAVGLGVRVVEKELWGGVC
jgi:transcriptional antiterminator NusG